MDTRTLEVTELPEEPFSMDHVPDGIGASRHRPDGPAKAAGYFEFSSDLHVDGMLWGATLRSPHPRALIESIDTSRASQIPGVFAVLTAADIPGENLFGLMVKDQPVLAESEVRFLGEAVAVVAAVDATIARRACEAISVQYLVLPAVTSVEEALLDGGPTVHPGGNTVREVHVRRGDHLCVDHIRVEGAYEMGMQDQAALGTESGLAVPSSDGLDVYVNTQWTHADRDQLATVLNMAPGRIRVHTSGVGGAFGSREDITLQAHLCLLAQVTGRAIKMQYTREESFLGHVHRHPAWMTYRHCVTRDGLLASVEARLYLDGGAYASTSPAVGGNAALFAVGPYECATVDLRVTTVYTNNPPCGAMRGFGAVQPAFAYEMQMDRLAATLGMDRLEIRLKNALREDSRMPTGQALEGRIPVTEMLLTLRALPKPSSPSSEDLAQLMSTDFANVGGRAVRRGVGYGIGFKAGGIPEGERDFTVARVRVLAEDQGVRAEVENAAVEVGQGLLVVQEQIVTTELGITDVTIIPTTTSRIGSAGSSSASRATYMTAGALHDACQAIRHRLIERAQDRFGHRIPELFAGSAGLTLTGGLLCTADGAALVSLVDVIGDEPIEETRRYDHRPTTPIDADGQGSPHLQFIFCAHRAVVDVDTDTGLVRVVEITAVQDVGLAINPLAIEGQMQGGTAQGVGLALMEELVVENGVVRNPSFTDYLIPTALDIPDIHTVILEFPDPAAPFGLKGVGEPSIISSPPAVASAVADAIGHPIDRVPIAVEDLLVNDHSPSPTVSLYGVRRRGHS